MARKAGQTRSSPGTSKAPSSNNKLKAALPLDIRGNLREWPDEKAISRIELNNSRPAAIILNTAEADSVDINNKTMLIGVSPWRGPWIVFQEEIEKSTTPEFTAAVEEIREASQRLRQNWAEQLTSLVANFIATQPQQTIEQKRALATLLNAKLSSIGLGAIYRDSGVGTLIVTWKTNPEKDSRFILRPHSDGPDKTIGKILKDIDLSPIEPRIEAGSHAQRVRRRQLLSERTK